MFFYYRGPEIFNDLWNIHLPIFLAIMGLIKRGINATKEEYSKDADTWDIKEMMMQDNSDGEESESSTSNISSSGESRSFTPNSNSVFRIFDIRTYIPAGESTIHPINITGVTTQYMDRIDTRGPAHTSMDLILTRIFRLDYNREFIPGMVSDDGIRSSLFYHPDSPFRSWNTIYHVSDMNEHFSTLALARLERIRLEIDFQITATEGNLPYRQRLISQRDDIDRMASDITRLQNTVYRSSPVLSAIAEKKNTNK